MRPFSDEDTFATFGNVTNTVRQEIDGLDNEYVIKASVSELEEHFIAKGSVAPLVLHPDDYYIESQRAAGIDVSHDFLRGEHGDGRPIVVPGTELKIAIPFKGDPALWKIRASTFSLGGYPDIEVGDGKITVSVTFPDDRANADDIKRQIDHDVKSLVDAVGNLAKDVAKHNASVRQLVPNAIERKRTKALAAVNAVASLGIPMKRAEHPPTYSIPARRRPSPVSRPAVATEKYEPEPALSLAEYDFILSITRSMALVIERNPASFGALDEEAIRDHFLLQLNGHYEGSATGETFNASGKTDILIRSNNRNVFIAECKFWRGAKQFDAAIDQLLGYLTWRDSKAALLVFNKNRDSTAVRGKMHEAITARPEHRKMVSHDSAGDSRYVLVKESDPGREILLTTQLYDLPDQEGAVVSD
jgi:hypothetical protein